MGRVKLEIKKIENPTNRQVTYSKRRNGLLKKAYELSVLCDIDIAVIMYSPSGKLTVQCRPETKIESILQRFAETPPQERAKRRNENLELLAKIVTRLSGEREAENHLYRVQNPGDWRPAVDQSELHPKPREIDDLRHLVEHAQPLDDVISARVQRSSSIAALDQIEESLHSGLSKVRERKAALLENMRARQQFHQHMSAALRSSHPGECYQTGIPVAGSGEGLPQYFSADNNPYLQHLHQMQSPAFQQVNAREWQFKGKDVVGPESSGRDWHYKGKDVVRPESSGRDWQYKGKDVVGPESSGRDWQYKGEGVVGPESSGRDWQYKGEGVVGTGTSSRDWQLKVEGVVGPGTSNRDWQYKREGIVGQGTSNRDWQFKGEGAVGPGTSTVESDVFPGIQYELDPSIGYPNPTPPYC